MAYAPGSLNLDHPVMGGGLDAGSLSIQHWTYVSADTVATVIAAGYVSDGDDKGMKVNDVCTVVDSNVPSIDYCLVTVVDSAGLVTMIQLA